MKANRTGDGTPNQQLFVVGIGASAGGLDPLQQLFEHMPADTGAVFVVVQHLSPDFKSMMRSLLERHTDMEVLEVTDGMRCEPNHVYLLPPKKAMVLEQGCLRLRDQTLGADRRVQLPIDEFLESLASDCRERAIAVVLSGAGADGTIGVRAVHNAGGLVLVQSPESAQFDSMPNSALGTGVAHGALPPSEIARTINDYVRRDGFDDTPDPFPGDVPDARAVQEIVNLLRADSPLDFRHYRPGTLSRRISRRMSMAGERDIERYMRLLAEDAEERNTLRNDLLIGVTSFFRDRPAWDALEKHAIAPLLDRDRSGPIRCWVTACSTGEEVYSLAMLISECQARAGTKRPVKIFATDIDKRALETAAAGVYPAGSLQELGPERLARFFVPEGSAYRIARPLREMAIFAEHNLNRDAPLTNMDIVTCRNALIYMQESLQQRVVATLHFALRVGGMLLLGSAETCGELAPEFAQVDSRWKLFAKRRSIVIRPEGRRPALSLLRPVFPPRSREIRRPPERVEMRDSLVVQAFRGLLHEREAACFLIDGHDQLLHSFGKPQLYSRIPEGAGAQGFAQMLLPELSMPLGSALQAARSEGHPARYTGIALPPGTDGVARSVDLTAMPIEGEGGIPLFLVTIEDSARAPHGESRPFTVDEHVTGRILDLERELQATRDSLQAGIEELETSNEEHQASIEELETTNEELQSTNEELQSVNEELYTVNAEHHSKIHELTALNNDVENLLRNTPMATLFLDRGLRIRKLTAGFRDVVSISESDVGRRIDDFTHRLVGVDLWKKLEQVLGSGAAYESVVHSKTGRHYLLRALPYVDEEGTRDGLVITLMDAEPLQQLLESAKPLAKQRTARPGDASDATENA